MKTNWQAAILNIPKVRILKGGRVCKHIWLWIFGGPGVFKTITKVVCCYFNLNQFRSRRQNIAAVKMCTTPPPLPWIFLHRLSILKSAPIKILILYHTFKVTTRAGHFSTFWIRVLNFIQTDIIIEETIHAIWSVPPFLK